MKASKKDYEALVNVVRMLEKGKTKRLMWGLALARVLRKSNPLFECDKFIQACGADDEQ